MAEQEYPEPTVGCLIVNHEGKLFFMKSHKWKNKYVIPGGHIELGETAEQALVREIMEETNLTIFDMHFLCIQEAVFAPDFWKKKHFIFIDFMARTTDTHVKLNHEAQGYVWATPKDAHLLDLEPYTRHALKEYEKRTK